MLPLTKLVRSVSRGFRGGEDGADCDLADRAVLFDYFSSRLVVD